ncbi:MAG: helix-turn-helix domain-containing protein [Spirochaetota bacterium]
MAGDITERLISAAERLMRAGRKAENLTIREIATEAGSSIGLVNYHFGSKDALIAKAAERIFADFTPRWERIAAAARAAAQSTTSVTVAAGDMDHRQAEQAAFHAGKNELVGLLKDVAQAVELAAGGNDFVIHRELIEGDPSTTKLLASALRSFLPPGTDERELRWAAYFIVPPLQLIFLRRDMLAEWTGTTLSDTSERNAVIDFLVDRILKPFAD